MNNLYLKDAGLPAEEGICCPLVEDNEQLTSMSGGCEMKCISSVRCSRPHTGESVQSSIHSDSSQG